jgi:hypothetical protein
MNEILSGKKKQSMEIAPQKVVERECFGSAR